MARICTKILFLVLLILFIVICLLIPKSVKKSHTNVFNKNWKKYGNQDYAFYDDRTFGVNIFKDPCTKINTNTAFRRYINKNVKCLGKWCINKTYSCKRLLNRNCYEVEHVIDKNGPEFKSNQCDKNIAANLVMAFGKWNAALGRLDYDLSIKEKRTVYSDKIANKIYSKILECQPNCKNDYWNEYDHKILLAVLVFLLIIISIITIMIYRQDSNFNNQEWNSMYSDIRNEIDN